MRSGAEENFQRKRIATEFFRRELEPSCGRKQRDSGLQGSQSAMAILISLDSVCSYCRGMAWSTSYVHSERSTKGQ